ncbi:hypothetical protein BKH43_06115 [Helicobacter sp. 13S00401-1]|uniref:DUF2018 family protein n=1 Tax=Helicobacter sp. 13S00401-1 TaxID=1905758 RepID=UPI000BA7837D|nr:DUF2018 family protein [Helicobacter sp. 13S00401-1]PAF50065.1 hypothetical protein BKH43_06115 [Helicobacter sp. 13S00401-1]
MWENKEDELDMFYGSPTDKWKDVIFNASRTLASKELDRLLEELALYELLFEEIECNVDLREFYYKVKNESSELKKRLEENKQSIALESTSKILSENE